MSHFDVEKSRVSECYFHPTREGTRSCSLPADCVQSAPQWDELAQPSTNCGEHCGKSAAWDLWESYFILIEWGNGWWLYTENNRLLLSIIVTIAANLRIPFYVLLYNVYHFFNQQKYVYTYISTCTHSLQQTVTTNAIIVNVFTWQ